MVKRGRKKKPFNLKLLFLIFGPLLIIFIVWFLFFSFDKCNDWDCFNSHLKSCDRVKFIGGDEMVFEYSIFRDKGDICRVGIILLQGEFSNQDSIKLENKGMVCNLPKGAIMLPESDLLNCHGLLKEGLQELVIEKLHTYIVQNLGRLNLEVLEIPSV
tara:strand:- start:6245 stop:6718 length:474 start_codon:yes stop_codon:yes gene_type:complete